MQEMSLESELRILRDDLGDLRAELDVLRGADEALVKPEPGRDEEQGDDRKDHRDVAVG
jgi:hypothetical protein